MDEDAFDEIYAASFARLVGQLYALVGDRDEAQECVQEAFVRAWSHRPGSSTATGPRRRGYARRRTDSPSAAGAARSVPAAPRTAHSSRRSGARHPTRSGSLLEALRQLPEPQRRALVLHHVCDLPVQEVAAGVSRA